MTLSKLEIQQMLREMNVKFDADETHEELKQRLQKENHSLWLKSVSGSQAADGRDGRIRVRKRKRSVDPPEPLEKRFPDRIATAEKAARLPVPPRNNTGAALRARTVEKPQPGKPWKTVADGTQPFNRKKNVFKSVLRRCGMCCEACGKPADKADPSTELRPFYIDPLSQGGEHSVKNMVALCSACCERLENDPSPKLIKELRRKTRSKLYDSLQVIRKTTVRSRGPFPGRRK
ncbi:HNH endonuclease [Desulfosarcina ovata]|uniref:HNH domain-containing protein n=1 Tax=Desulfosarcina ovata subsp. ovata TaxID=2752305 RepID=A0A5K8A593_9BACT|nr:HNH endonuclease [Desulfosarcina ovata]BBO87699.1 hypothetical protein DSCOOX_08790 [Desulfosarcina ovata subsp. ovata]